ncbi:MAG TPA: glycosyltransferase family 2 protein [Solirubrobacteraceae bacterium]|nr:glycosyltransferase family 2 protein [Solirubrobacteraceae bacterium]
MRPRASIIIVTYGQRALTEQCLRSLERSLGPKLGRELELVLVDNDSPDDTPTLLREWSDRAVVELLRENRNFAGGCNAGARLAHGEALIFLNNDTEVPPGALEALADQALEPGVSLAGCRLHFPDGTLQHGGVAFLRGRALGGAAMPQHVFYCHSPEIPAVQSTYECDSVTAACMAVRASSFAAVRGFDEGFRNGLEDIDLCLRIRMLGESVVYRGDIVLVHHEGASRGRGEQLFATPAKLATMRHNDERFTARWGAALDQDDEHARRLWGAGLEDSPPIRDLADTDCVVAGQPSAVGPGAAEARGLLAALAGAGHAPAAVDAHRANVVSPEARSAGSTLTLARRRIVSQSLPWILVPTGLHDTLVIDAPHIVRLGHPRTASPLHAAREVWASCPTVATALIDSGLEAQRIRVVPPFVSPAPLGHGGNGVLVVLPAHDRRRTRDLLDRLPRPTPDPMTLIPTVMARGLEVEIADRFPQAELIGPVADEARFSAMAAAADLVVVDDDDPFQRRALTAALRGTPVIAADRDGPVRWLLGESAVLKESTSVRIERERLADNFERANWASRAAACTLPRSLLLTAPSLASTS